MGIGKRKLAKLRRYTTQKGSVGENVTDLTAEYNIWAEVDNVSAFRQVQRGQTSEGETKDFKIRFDFDKFPDANWTIVYDGRQWEPTGFVKLDDKQFYWQVTGQAKT